MQKRELNWQGNADRFEYGKVLPGETNYISELAVWDAVFHTII